MKRLLPALCLAGLAACSTAFALDWPQKADGGTEAALATAEPAKPARAAPASRPKAAEVAEVTCADSERPHYPKQRGKRPFCEPIVRCGLGRVAVPSAVAGKKMCVPK